MRSYRSRSLFPDRIFKLSFVRMHNIYMQRKHVNRVFLPQFYYNNR